MYETCLHLIIHTQDNFLSSQACWSSWSKRDNCLILYCPAAAATAATAAAPATDVPAITSAARQCLRQSGGE